MRGRRIVAEVAMTPSSPDAASRIAVAVPLIPSPIAAEHCVIKVESCIIWANVVAEMEKGRSP